MSLSFSSRTYFSVLLLSCAVFGIAVPFRSAAQAPTVKSGAAQTPAAFFISQVQPILVSSCYSCHSGDKPTAGLSLTSREAILKGGVSGAAVSLEKPEQSLLLTAINYQGRQMPPSGKLAQAQIAILTRWIQIGMPWGTSKQAEPNLPKHIIPPQVTPENMKFWSFQPIKSPHAPLVKHATWVHNPIDAFVLKRLEAAGLAPNPVASRETRIRRAYYDLTGLPPTPEEVRAFQADKSPGSWEKVVDRLLASPRYGEKWGRHWLDLVHFAETNSYERDSVKPNAWRYRDYVIQSFNADKPYSRFVLEQLAGDEIGENTPEDIIATGYYRLGIWDDEPSDADQALYDDLDDIVSTTGQVFLGLTVGCARCHDHKIDPIPQKDYYRFLALFNGINRYGPGDIAQKPISLEAEQQKERVAVAAHIAKLQENKNLLLAIEKRIEKDLTPVEKEEFQHDESHVALLRKRVPGILSQQDFDRYLSLREERAALEKSPPSLLDRALCVTEAKKPRETHILLRGNPHNLGEMVEPGFLSILAPPSPNIVPSAGGESSGRRLALARWIADKNNPLTARVLANRIWQYHFGRGLVRTSSNFGFQGSKPTHPELLDWLASELVRQNWKWKPIHKLILMSAAYQMSSLAQPAALAKDPENDLFWRFDMRRLEAEEIRDSILQADGSLNLQMNGPGVYPTIPAAVMAGQSRPGSGWGTSPVDQQHRRSIYIHVKRSLITPTLASFDGPETDFTCPIRFSTTQPTQALSMLNSDFINQEARIFAHNLIQRAGSQVTDQVRLCLWRVLQREPTVKEVTRGIHLITSLEKQDHVSSEDALAYFCVVALNLNEFLYLD